MINESPGAGFFTDVFKTYVRRGLTWYVSKREEHLAAAVYGHNDWGHPWQRQLMTEVMPGASVIEVIDNLYFSSVRLVACAERSIPLDDVSLGDPRHNGPHCVRGGALVIQRCYGSITMSGLFGLDGNDATQPIQAAPKYTTKLRSLMPMTASWHAVYRHNPVDPNELSLIPVIGIATVDIVDLSDPNAPTSSTVFRPFVMMPSGTITDAASLGGFVCLVSEEQDPEVSEEHVQDTVSAYDASGQET